MQIVVSCQGYKDQKNSCMITVDEVKSKTTERFWSKIHFGEPNECWEWTAYKDRDGYGNFRIKNSNGEHTMIGSHRYVYRMVVKDFDNSLSCLHSCDNPRCVNPNHLWIGTNGDNVRDMFKKGRDKVYSLPAMIGSQHPRAKLNENNVKAIKLELSKGVKQRDVAKKYQVYPTVISKIKNGVLWRHVTI